MPNKLSRVYKLDTGEPFNSIAPAVTLPISTDVPWILRWTMFLCCRSGFSAGYALFAINRNDQRFIGGCWVVDDMDSSHRNTQPNITGSSVCEYCVARTCCKER